MKRILPILLLLVLLITSCSKNRLYDNQISGIDYIFSKFNKTDSPGCSVGIIKDGELIFSKGYGMANLENNIKISPNTLFRIASTSKQFTAACILILEKQGKLSLDDTLEKYFPEFPEYSKNITIKHLLNHTSGIRDYYTLGNIAGIDNSIDYGSEDILNFLMKQKDLNFLPGEEFLYSNSGYVLAELIINKITGLDLNDFAQKEIFKPLGMNDTFYQVYKTNSVENLAIGYEINENDGFQLVPSPLVTKGDGGVCTSIEDIKKWDDAFYNSDIFNREFWKKLITQSILNNGDTIDYAIGLKKEIYKGLKTIKHAGGMPGYRSQFIRFPDQHLSIIILANRDDCDPTSMCLDVANILLKDKFKAESLSKIIEKAITTPAKTDFKFEQLTGRYVKSPGVEIFTSIDNDSLHFFVKVPGKTNEFNIGRINGDTFLTPGGNAVVFSSMNENCSQKFTFISNNAEMVFRRMNEIDMSKVDLREYTGEYLNDSFIDTKYALYVENDTLKAKVEDNEPIVLYMHDIDQFYAENIFCQFNRTNGKITEAILDADRVKNMKFVKLK